MDVDNPAPLLEKDTLLVGEDERGYFITAVGSVRAGLCYPLRDVLLFRLEETRDVPAVFVDLSRCLYMDSTFIGLLVAIDKKLQKGSGGRLHVMDAGAECLDLLRQLGLQEILLLETGGVSAPPMKSLDAPAERPGAEFVLRAHEALMESSDEARRKFSVLRDVLERKLRGEKPRGDTR
jgi:anti-anti-sigma regulatory factor